MNNKQLLINRTVTSDEMHSRLGESRVNWYTPGKYFRSFKSVVKADYWDMTSSAGDWSGWFVQKIGNKFYLIRFSQEGTVWGSGGYTAYTGNVLAEWDGEMLPDETIWQILKENDEMYQ